MKAYTKFASQYMEYCRSIGIDNEDVLKAQNRDVVFDSVRRFAVSVRTLNGELFSRSTFKVLLWSVKRYVFELTGFNVSNDPKFKYVTKNMELQINKSEKSIVKPRTQITPQDLITIYNSLDDSNPTNLQHKVFFTVLFLMCKRGALNMHSQTKSTFQVCSDSENREYITKVSMNFSYKEFFFVFAGHYKVVYH